MIFEAFLGQNDIRLKSEKQNFKRLIKWLDISYVLSYIIFDKFQTVCSSELFYTRKFNNVFETNQMQTK